HVTGVQTCALPIFGAPGNGLRGDVGCRGDVAYRRLPGAPPRPRRRSGRAERLQAAEGGQVPAQLDDGQVLGLGLDHDVEGQVGEAGEEVGEGPGNDEVRVLPEVRRLDPRDAAALDGPAAEAERGEVAFGTYVRRRG